MTVGLPDRVLKIKVGKDCDPEKMALKSNICFKRDVVLRAWRPRLKFWFARNVFLRTWISRLKFGPRSIRMWMRKPFSVLQLLV